MLCDVPVLRTRRRDPRAAAAVRAAAAAACAHRGVAARAAPALRRPRGAGDCHAVRGRSLLAPLTLLYWPAMCLKCLDAVVECDLFPKSWLKAPDVLAISHFTCP